MLKRRDMHFIEDEYNISLHARGSGPSSLSSNSPSFPPRSKEELSKFVIKCLTTVQHMNLIKNAYTRNEI